MPSVIWLDCHEKINNMLFGGTVVDSGVSGCLSQPWDKPTEKLVSEGPVWGAFMGPLTSPPSPPKTSFLLACPTIVSDLS